MTVLYPVLVKWSDRKREMLPTSGQYSTVARFAQDAKAWPSEGWSVVLHIRGDVHADPCLADARFLSEFAPEERFKSGVDFELLEGQCVVAKVHVI